ncbi:hypothetical protein HK101_003219, partial [Irineochytrium annulatum]
MSFASAASPPHEPVEQLHAATLSVDTKREDPYNLPLSPPTEPTYSPSPVDNYVLAEQSLSPAPVDGSVISSAGTQETMEVDAVETK